jgi:L-ascorbate metabolism protein UlaG (beta-lactamase superfamily)
LDQFTRGRASVLRRLVTTIRYVGHSTVLIELDGVTLLTDPLLRRRVAHLHRRSPIDLEAVRSPDAVLISHAHRDHLDLPSLRRLDRSATALVPRGLAGPVERLGFARLVEIDEEQSVTIGPVEVRATHAEHDERRRLGPLRGATLGYAIDGTHRVYFAGDTSLFPEMDGLVPDLDLALIPIWGWGPTLGSGEHLDPAGAAEALRMLRPRMAIPIHWGTYRPLHHGVRREPDFLTKPAEDFVREVEKTAPEVEVRILQPGERIEL